MISLITSSSFGFGLSVISFLLLEREDEMIFYYFEFGFADTSSPGSSSGITSFRREVVLMAAGLRS